jgi:hypothetical protein
MKQICSLNELPLDQRKSVRFIAIYMGLFTCLLGMTVLLLLDAFPFFPPETGVFYLVTCLLSLNPPILLFVLGYGIGQLLKLRDLGYSLQSHTINFSNHSDFLSNDIVTHQPCSVSSSMSINPASGLPMSGSSLMDSRGNPLGTNSWS